MKRLLISCLPLKLALLFFVQLHATEQVPDYLMYNGRKLVLNTGWGHPSPLEVYYSKNRIKYPFEALSTANYRGHVATWKIRNDQLILRELRVGDTVQKPEYYGIKARNELALNDGVLADWFSGIIACNDGDDYYFHVKDGRVVNAESVTKRDYKRFQRLSPHDSTNSRLLNKLSLVLMNQQYIAYHFRLADSDTIINGEKGGRLESKVTGSPILAYYRYDHMKWPYNWENLQRSGAPHGTWKIEENKVYLTNVVLHGGTSFFEVETDSVRLEEIFGHRVSAGRVLADWLSGIYIIKHGTEKIDTLLPGFKEFTPTGYTYLRITNGLVEESHTVPIDFDFNSISADTDPGLTRMLNEIGSNL